MFFVVPGAICKRIWVETRSYLDRDAFVSRLRGVRIWGKAQLRMGQGTIERWTAFAGKSGSRFFRLLCDKR